MNRLGAYTGIARSYSTKLPDGIRGVQMIRQHGVINWYFQERDTRENWTGLNYAAKRGWRVIESYDGAPGWVTLKCEPINVKHRGGYEEEIPPEVKEHD